MSLFRTIAYGVFFAAWFIARKLGLSRSPMLVDMKAMNTIDGFKKES